MRGVLLAFLLVTGAYAVSTPALTAQARVVRWQESRASVDGEASSLSAPVLTPQVQAASSSTLFERFSGGFVVGGLAALATAERYDGQPVAAAYALGTAAGVFLATVARERPRPLPILLGTALGAVPLFALASAESSHPLSLPIFVIGAVATPLLGAISQRW